MYIFDAVAEAAIPRLIKRCLVGLAISVILITAGTQDLFAQDDAQAPTAAAAQPPYTQQAPEQLQQLVAPIALYPDSLVAQILAASTFPEQIVEAEPVGASAPNLQGDALAQAVDQQPWDPSVKALDGISIRPWEYGQEPCLDILFGRRLLQPTTGRHGRRASDAPAGRGGGQFEDHAATNRGDAGFDSIVIQPASPDIVYVPAYDPWLIYGDPMVAWPGWYPYPGIWYDGPYLSFGIGFGIGFFGGFGWGWGHWGFDWHHRYPMYNHERYYSRSNTFYNRSNYYRAGGERGVQSNVARGMSGNRAGNAERAGGGLAAGAGGTGRAAIKPFGGRNEAARGYAEPRGESGVRSGAFSGYDHGGQTRGFSSRGSSSFGGSPGGGGASHGGGRPR